MSSIHIVYVQRPPSPLTKTYIAACCREWIAPYGFKGTKCKLCGTKPVYLRPDPDSPHGGTQLPMEETR